MPQRGSLVAECLRVMRLRIEAGEWSEFLPGERRLAELLQVGRDTVRLTLGELEVEGYIEPASAGSRRRIAKRKGGPAKAGRVGIKVGMLSPHRLERLSQSMLLEVDHIRQSLAGKEIRFEVFAPGWYEQSQPEKRLAELMKAERCAAWILHRSSPAVQRWFAEQRTPCLVRGMPHENVDLPFLDVDWAATARHAAGNLWRLGHRRVAIITPPDRLAGVAAAVRGAMDLGEEGFEVIEFAENGSVEGVLRVLQRALALASPPTAFIATRPRQVATLLSSAAASGLRVPGDISMISLSREPFLEFLVPEVTGYRSDPAVVARQVVRRVEQLIAGNLHPGGNSWLQPEMIPGGSVGRLKGR